MKNKNKASVNPVQYRQGDVAIERVDSFPSNLKPAPLDKGRVILAYGEVTGHAHTFCAEDCTKLTDERGSEFFDVTGRPLNFRLPIVRKWKNQVMVKHPKLGIIEFAMVDVQIEDGQVIVAGDFGLLQHDEHHAHGVKAGRYIGGGDGGKVNQREYTPAGIVRTRD